MVIFIFKNTKIKKINQFFPPFVYSFLKKIFLKFFFPFIYLFYFCYYFCYNFWQVFPFV